MKKFTLSCLSFYQKYLSFDSGFFRTLCLSESACRFSPHCSAYTYQAVSKYGTIPGLWLGLKRVLRCHPGNPGGLDPLK